MKAHCRRHYTSWECENKFPLLKFTARWDAKSWDIISTLCFDSSLRSQDFDVNVCGLKVTKVTKRYDPFCYQFPILGQQTSIQLLGCLVSLEKEQCACCLLPCIFSTLWVLRASIPCDSLAEGKQISAARGMVPTTRQRWSSELKHRTR